jgi:hypothetical protein
VHKHTDIHTYTHTCLALVRVVLELVARCADLGLCLRHGDVGCPVGWPPGHLIDEVDLDRVGHPIEGHVLASLVLGTPVAVELHPCIVPLLTHRRLVAGVALVMVIEIVARKIKLILQRLLGFFDTEAYYLRIIVAKTR